MDLPKRKHPRLKDYDYSQDGLYFITICTHGKKHIFSTIDITEDLENSQVQLTEAGIIAENHLVLLEERYKNANIITNVIMPNHIHFILAIENKESASTYSVQDMVCAYKSLVAKECKKRLGIEKLFQVSFYDHIIKNEKDFENTVLYIERNPARWIYDKYYSDGTFC